jgi:hypothetical protein
VASRRTVVCALTNVSVHARRRATTRLVMKRSRRLAPAAQRALDAALILWIVAWLWMGIAVANEVRGIADLSDTVGAVGRAVTGVGVLLGVSIALFPTLPLLATYLPTRYAAAHERRALRRAMDSGRSDALDELLARRALVHLPYHRLRRVSDDPVD